MVHSKSAPTCRSSKLIQETVKRGHFACLTRTRCRVQAQRAQPAPHRSTDLIINESELASPQSLASTSVTRAPPLTHARVERILDISAELPLLLGGTVFTRRLGPDPHMSDGPNTPASAGCPDLWELADGRIAVIGERWSPDT